MDSDFNPEPENRPEFQNNDSPQSAVEPTALNSSLSSPIDLAGSPVQISDQFWRLDRRNINVERISGLIFSSILFVILIVGIVALWFVIDFGWIWFTACGVALAITAASFWFAIFWPTMNHNRSSWRLDREGLEIRHGVLFRHCITVPLGRVQHADVSQGPLQRQFDVGTLTVHTAGTQHASIPLQGLAHTNAIELRDLIVQQKKDQHAV